MNTLLFGGATAAKKYPGGLNYHGNDWEATRYLSNYAELPNPVIYGGVAFPSVEQAYVAAKFNDPAMSSFIAGIEPGVDRYGNRSMPAQVARNLGRARPKYAASEWAAAGFEGQVKPLRADWENVKVEVMRDLVAQKFRNNPEFARALLATGDQELIEHTTGWGDRVWGMVDPQANRVGRDADPARLEGENHLGRLLMEQRAALGGTGLVGRFAPAPEHLIASVMPMGQEAAVAAAVEPERVQLELALGGGGGSPPPPRPPVVVMAEPQRGPGPGPAPQPPVADDPALIAVQEDPKRKAGDLLPWLLAAGGGAAAGGGLAYLMQQGQAPQDGSG